MKQAYTVRVRRWRSSTNGCAWQVHYDNGRIVRLIEAPYPRGPISAAVFLHEVAHHAIGFYKYKPSCLEELKAWKWALAKMKKYDIPVTDKVRTRVIMSLRYAVSKAQQRGLRRIPRELRIYLQVLATQSA